MSTSSPLDMELNRNIHQYLGDFFLSLQGDGRTLKTFLGKLSAFNATIQSHRHRLQEETLVSARNFATVVDTVVMGMFELDKASDRLQDEAATDITKILDEQMGSLYISDKQSKRPSGLSPYPAYIKPSYQWLISNLHNPYPSKDVKKEIAQQTACSLKDIDAWFVDTRKRIGWNKLRKIKFSNKQEKIIAAATHVFKPKMSCFSDDLNVSLASEMDPYDVYRRDFIAIADTAKSLYADRFPDLTLPAFLDHSVDYLPLTVMQRKQVTNNHCQAVHRTSNIFGHAVVAPYPTPEPSPQSHVMEEPSLDLVPDTFQMRSGKRRHLSLDAGESDNRPSKRCRSDMNSLDSAAAVESLPSPSSSIVDLSEYIDESPSSAAEIAAPMSALSNVSALKRKRRLSGGESNRPSKHTHLSSTPEVLDVSVVAEISPLKRKRRLSDGESQCPPKRPHNAFAQPRLQTVSNPFPMMMKPSFTDLFETLTQNDGSSELDLSDIPSPTALQTPLSQNVPLDIYQGQYDISTGYLDPYSEVPLTGIVNEGSTLSSSQNAKSFLNFVDHHYYPECSQNSMFDVAIGTTDLPVFDYISAPAYDLSLDTLNDNSPQSLPTSEWSAYLQADKLSYNSSQSLPPTGNAKRDDTTPLAFPDPKSSDAKRAKIQALNEQIRLLEAEL